MTNTRIMWFEKPLTPEVHHYMTINGIIRVTNGSVNIRTRMKTWVTHQQPRSSGSVMGFSETTTKERAIGLAL